MIIAILVGSLLLVAVVWWLLSQQAEAKTAAQLSPETLADSLADGLVLIDKTGQVKLFNAAAAQVSGRPAKQVLGIDIRQVLPLVNIKGQNRTDAENLFFKVLKTGQVMREKMIFLAAQSGQHTPISLVISPVGSTQAPAGAIAIFRDISQEVAEDRAGNEFISTASHEMRTPLAAIEGYLSLALTDRNSQLNQTAHNYLSKAHTATQHLSMLFQDLLTSTRAEDGRLTSNPEVVEIGAAVAQVVDGARFSAENKGLELSYLVSRSQDTAAATKVIRPLYYVYADPQRIREVLQNIIDNAIKYTLSGAVKVALTGDERVVQIQVTDSGPGIAADDIPHLFQKFYRIDNSLTRSVGGTGLGLFICRKIIELYSGRIWVESSLGKGSTFFINLPRLTAEQATTHQAKNSAVMLN